MGKKSTKKEFKFEDSLKRLEDIVEKLEGGDVPLSDAVKLYEEGIKLSKDCIKQLTDVELKLRKISSNLDGSAEISDLE